MINHDNPEAILPHDLSVRYSGGNRLEDHKPRDARAYYTLAVVLARVRRRPDLPQVRQEMMMSKTETMPLMMAWKMAPMALTMEVRQLPMVRRRDLMRVWF
jgi:hypothetical protein